MRGERERKKKWMALGALGTTKTMSLLPYLTLFSFTWPYLPFPFLSSPSLSPFHFLFFLPFSPSRFPPSPGALPSSSPLSLPFLHISAVLTSLSLSLFIYLSLFPPLPFSFSSHFLSFSRHSPFSSPIFPHSLPVPLSLSFPSFPSLPLLPSYPLSPFLSSLSFSFYLPVRQSSFLFVNYQPLSHSNPKLLSHFHILDFYSSSHPLSFPSLSYPHSSSHSSPFPRLYHPLFP